VPTNTTRTAEYVAVATNVSTLVVFTPKDKAHAKRIMNTDDVIRLFTDEGFRVMIHIGATSAPTATNATISRTTLSTSGDTSAGGLPS
jgi:hypothetical protein